jgi:hypothetical protein
VGCHHRFTTAERKPLDPERPAAPDGTTVIAELHGFLDPGSARQVERCAATQPLPWPPDVSEHCGDIVRVDALSSAVMHACDLRRI